MTKYEEYRKQQMADPEFRAEYDALEPEFDIIKAVAKTRKDLNITQQELAERTGITQADISRIENGTRNPSLDLLKRLARGMGMQLKLEFVPVSLPKSQASKAAH